MNDAKNVLASALVGTIAALTSTLPAQAAETSPVIDEVIVTARKQAESLQSTPVAVTAVTAEQLVNAQVVNAIDLQRTAPGLVVSRGTAGTSGFAFISIRGQGNLQPILANDPAVATYVDGVYIPRPSQGQTDLIDIDRVEILRGPQGTLFGRNTTGGAVNILTSDPSNELALKLKADVGNRNYREAGFVLNAPITQNLAGRVVYNFHQDDGYGHNQTLDRDVADVESHFVRAKLRYAGEQFSVTLSGDYNKMTDQGQLVTLAAANAPLIRGALAGLNALPGGAALISSIVDPLQPVHDGSNWYNTYGASVRPPTIPPGPTFFALVPPSVQAKYSELPHDKLTAYGSGLTIDFKLADLNVKSISAYREQQNDGLIDTDGTPSPLLATFAGAKSEQYSQELQLSGDVGKRFSYILGGYWSRETGYEYSRSQLFAGAIRDSDADAKNISKGAFAQGYFDITDKLRTTAGLRYTWDTRDTDLHNSQILGLPSGFVVPVSVSPTGFNCTNINILQAPVAERAALAADCSLMQHATFNYPAWTFGLDWQATDTLFMYAKTSRAAKAGGWNLRAGALPSFEPEEVTDVELGVKADWLEERLRTNLALFYSWKDQVQALKNAVVPGIGVTQFIQNNGKARIWGAELELVALPWQGMELTGALSLMDGEYESGSFTDVQVVGGQQVVVDQSSLPLTQLPKSQFNIGATQALPLGTGELRIHLDYSYVGKQWFNAVLPADSQPQAVKDMYAIENQFGSTPGYGLLNARIGYKFGDSGLEVAAFGRNLTDKEYLVRRFSDLYRQVGFAAEYPGEPRTYGVSLNWQFGQ